MSVSGKATGGAVRRRPFLARTWPLLLLLGFLALAVGYGESLKGRAQEGRPAPVFTLPDLDGNEVSLADFQGQPVILNFWATWCPTCRHETPAHQAFLERFGDSVQYLAINLREPPDKVRQHRAHFASLGVPLEGRWELLDRKGRVFSLYRFTGTPETWVIDGEGRAVRHFVGASTFEDLVSAAEAAGLQLWREPATGWVHALAWGQVDGEGRLWAGGGLGVFRLHAGAGGGGVAVEQLPVPLERVRSLSAAQEGGRLWMVGHRAGGGGRALAVWREGDGTWEMLLEDGDPLAVAAGPGGRVYVWTREQGLLVSGDGGRTWEGRTAPFQPEVAGVAMAVDPWDANHLLSAGPGGVWRTRDGGETWAPTEVQRPVSGIAFDPGRPGRVYFSDREGVLYSTDGGRTAQRWMGSPQRQLVAVAGGAGAGPVGVAANGDLYRAGAFPEAGGLPGPAGRWSLLPGIPERGGTG